MNTLYTTLSVLITVLSVPSVAGQFSTTATTAPQTTAPQTTGYPSWFQGYYFYPEDDVVKTSIVACDHDKVWVTRGDYATCCNPNPTGEQCGMAIACSGDEIEFDTGNVVYCGAVCASMVIYETSPWGGPSATNYFCHNKWTINTVYRQLPESTTTTDTDTANTSPPTTTTAIVTTVLTFDTSNNDNNDNNDKDDEDNKDEDKDKPSPNNHWIVGAIIGPIAGVAIILLAVWYLWRHNQNKKTKISSLVITSPITEPPLAEYYKPTPPTKPAITTHNNASGTRAPWNPDSYSHLHSHPHSHSHSPSNSHSPPSTFVSRTIEPRELENSERTRFPSHFELSGDSRLR